jgi:hypothetical protein
MNDIAPMGGARLVLAASSVKTRRHLVLSQWGSGENGTTSHLIQRRAPTAAIAFAWAWRDFWGVARPTTANSTPLG